jgi:hypothetical protein
MDPRPTDRDERARVEDSDTGGDAACWANLLCEECGAVTGDEHHAGCSRAG